MAHLVIGWELGHGMGHIMPLRMIAEQLLQRGHRLTVIGRDSAACARALSDLPLTWLAAPVVRYRPWELTRTDCYSQLLGNVGFRDVEKLSASVGGWTGLLRELKPDAALLEFAPSAMLACHVLEVPFALQGNGFFCPPVSVDDFGLMNPKMAAAERLEEDRLLLDSINQVAADYRTPPLAHISELYRLARHTVLTTFAELDHFSRQDNSHFSGIWVPRQTQQPLWPDASGKRLFAYLNARPGVERVLTMLAGSGLPTLIACSGLSAEQRAPFETASCHFLDTLVDMPALAAQADLGVFHGNHSSSAQFLLAGTPSLQLPIYMEQLMFARRVKQLGGCEIATLDQPERINQALNLLISVPHYRAAAERFAARHADHDQDREIRLAADMIEQRLLARP